MIRLLRLLVVILSGVVGLGATGVASSRQGPATYSYDSVANTALARGRQGPVSVRRELSESARPTSFVGTLANSDSPVVPAEGVTNAVPESLEFAKVIKPEQVAQLQAGATLCSVPSRGRRTRSSPRRRHSLAA